MAISNKRVDTCKLLLDAGADLMRTAGENSYLFWAAFTDTDPAIVEMLLARGAKVGLRATHEGVDVARRRAQPDVVALFERALAGATSDMRRTVDRVRPVVKPGVIEAGTSVRVVGGAFSNMSGTVEEALSDSRFRVAVAVFGRPVRVDLERSDVEVR